MTTKNPKEAPRWFTILRHGEGRIEVIHFYGTPTAAEIRATAGLREDDDSWNILADRASISLEVEISA